MQKRVTCGAPTKLTHWISTNQANAEGDLVVCVRVRIVKARGTTSDGKRATPAEFQIDMGNDQWTDTISVPQGAALPGWFPKK